MCLCIYRSSSAYLFSHMDLLTAGSYIDCVKLFKIKQYNAFFIIL